jgi:Kelch motif protein
MPGSAGPKSSGQLAAMHGRVSHAGTSRLAGVLITALLLLASLMVSAWVGASPAAATTPTAVWAQAAALTPGPPAVWAPAMAYDPAARQVVLFGGSDPNGDTLNGTWTWDGTTWTQVFPMTSPPARNHASMAYDPATSQLVLFGGSDTVGHDLNDTWTWSGTTWTNITPSTGNPVARESASMAYDAGIGKVVLFGGYEASTTGLLNDTWTWDGAAWTQVTSLGGPSARDGSSMVYDPGTSGLVLFGGNESTDPFISGFLDDTWTWDGSTWANVTPSTGNPGGRVNASMAYDAGLNQPVLFGGGNNSVPFLGDTWAWDGTTSAWTQLAVSPAVSPPARFGAGMAYDPASSQLVLFGGWGNSGFLDDTWTYSVPEAVAPPRPVITQAQPLSGTVSPSGLKHFRAHLAVAGPGGVGYVTTSRWCGLAVSPAGVITIRGHLPSGGCTVSGTDSGAGAAGTWTYTLTVGVVTITQVKPVAATTTAAASAGFTGRFRTNGGRGQVRYVTTSRACGLIVSPAGAISTRGRMKPGHCTVSGTDTDTSGARGRWTFTLTITR